MKAATFTIVMNVDDKKLELIEKYAESGDCIDLEESISDIEARMHDLLNDNLYDFGLACVEISKPSPIATEDSEYDTVEDFVEFSVSVKPGPGLMMKPTGFEKKSDLVVAKAAIAGNANAKRELSRR